MYWACKVYGHNWGHWRNNWGGSNWWQWRECERCGKVERRQLTWASTSDD